MKYQSYDELRRDLNKQIDRFRLKKILLDKIDYSKVNKKLCSNLLSIIRQLDAQKIYLNNIILNLEHSFRESEKTIQKAHKLKSSLIKLTNKLLTILEKVCYKYIDKQFKDDLNKLNLKNKIYVDPESNKNVAIITLKNLKHNGIFNKNIKFYVIKDGLYYVGKSISNLKPSKSLKKGIARFLTENKMETT